jgi:hypothetical protein
MRERMVTMMTIVGNPMTRPAPICIDESGIALRHPAPRAPFWDEILRTGA